MINEAAEAVRMATVGAYNALRSGLAGRELWFRLAPYGEFPQTIETPRGPRRIVQLVDRESAEAMAANFQRLGAQAANLFRGAPIYEGHPDNGAWRARNPGVQAKAVGRIKEIEAREDVPWARAVFNEAGIQLISGDAAPYSGQSPNWDMEEVEGRPGVYRPVVLRSVGLLNTPNIAENAIGLNESRSEAPEAGAQEQENKKETNHMKPELLKRLGLAPEASDEAIAKAVGAALDRAEKLEAEKAKLDTANAALETKLNAANSATEKAEEIAVALREQAVCTAIATAVNDGRIAEADKERWTNALNADFEGESKKLGALMPTLNTENRVKDAGGRKAERAPGGGGITAINAAVGAYAKEAGLDLGNAGDYDKAYHGAKEAKPELFG